MSYALNFILSLAGSLCVTSALAAGEALRTDEPFARRITPRLLLSLALLGSAVVGATFEVLRAPAGLFSHLALLLLAAGTGTAVWAFLAGPRRRGDEALGERITPHGKLALGLLLAAQVADLSTGRALATVQLLRGPGSGTTPILGVLGLFLLVLGTGAAAAMFRSGSALLRDAGSVGQRFSPLAKGTFLLLAMALAVVGLAGLLAPESGLFLCLTLLTLGITTGLAALFLDLKAGAGAEPAPWGISARAWVSLGLLALAGLVLGAQEVQLLGTSASQMGGLGSPRADQSAAARPVADGPSVWSRWGFFTGSAGQTDQGTERAQLERQLDETKNKLASLEAAMKSGRPGGHPPTEPAPKPVPPGNNSWTGKVYEWHH
jgi:hypothetical protein